MVKKFFAFILLFALFNFTFVGEGFAQSTSINEEFDQIFQEEDSFRYDEILVEYKDDPGEYHKVKIAPEYFESASVNVYKTNSHLGKEEVESPVQEKYKMDLLKTKYEELKGDENINSIEPNYIYGIEWVRSGNTDTPNDFDSTPSYSTGNHWYYELSNLRTLWQLENCANAGSLCGGSDTVTVAVIDTGLAFEDHVSAWDDTPGNPITFSDMDDMFSGGGINLYTNSGETPNNNIDDDGNGFIDDYHGVDTGNYIKCLYPVPGEECSTAESAETGHPNDDGGHGTYVTGSIASLVDNGSGSVSPAQNVAIMPIKANFDEEPFFGSLELGYAIDYAVNHGADVINMSLSGTGTNSYLEGKVDNAAANGVLVVGSSGNSNGAVGFPAKFNSAVAVGSVTSTGARANYSNYGPEMELVAYVGNGGGVGDTTLQRSYTCFASDCYGSSDLSRYANFSNVYGIGTSFAAPQVAAWAALIKSHNPGFDDDDIRSFMQLNAVDLGTIGQDDDTGYGVIDFASSYVDFNVDEKYSPIYRWLNGDRAWIWVGNMSDIESASVKVELEDGNPNTEYSVIVPDDNSSSKFSDVSTGPARVTSDQNIYATLKVRTQAGFQSEYAFPDSSEEGTEFYYPVYRWKDGDKSWIWLANNSDSLTASVNVEIGGVDYGNYNVLPESAVSVKAVEVFDGPVKVTSNNPILTTMKILVGGGINEMAGISPSEFDTEFYYPIYRWKDGDRAWVWIGNPSDTNSANITVKIAGTTVNNFPLSPGQSVQVQHEDLFEGPVEITSTEPIFSTMKSSTNGVINEFPGIRSSDFAQKYSFPVYRWEDGDRAWAWIGNPSTTNTANISVKIAGTTLNNFPLPPGQSIQVKYEGVFDGPLVVESNEPIYVTLKSRVNDAINEFVGIH